MTLSNAPLPLKNGVAPSVVHVTESGVVLLDFLIKRFPKIARETWLARFAQGEVINQKGEVLHAQRLTVLNDLVFYYREVAIEPLIPFTEQILYLDRHLLVVDKPHFLPVTPSGGFLQQTLLTRLRHTLSIEALSPIHRLDKDTAGVMLFATQVATRGAYQALFQHKQVHKIYHALAPTRLDLSYPFTYESRLIEDKQQFFRMQESTGEPNTRTRITLLENRGELSLYQLEPQTGKKHQLRAHMNALDMPILNDAFYPVAHPAGKPDYDKPLQLLAKSISFVDPLTTEQRYFESPRSL
jgi:tRNA pseudouridine32 synthase/23S rRNA pseudouridine746 synthase